MYRLIVAGITDANHAKNARIDIKIIKITVVRTVGRGR